MRKKGQMNIEYVITMTLFITLVVYISFRLLNYTPSYTQAIRSEYLRSEAYQLSELLVNDVGEPSSWNTTWHTTPSAVKRLGLSEGTKTNLLSVDKITTMEEMCTSAYGYVTGRLGIDTNDYQISLFFRDSSSGSILLDCSPVYTVSRQDVATIKRTVALSSGGYGELAVQVW